MIHNQPITRKKITLIVGLFLLILTSLRIGWIVYHQPPDHPQAEKGISHLSDWVFTDKQTITLNGEWEFYPNQFLDPHTEGNMTENGGEFISVPSNWSGIFSSHSIPAYGYGTYKLKVILPDHGTHYGIHINEVHSAAAIYINGELVNTFNQPATVANDNIVHHGPSQTLFQTDMNEIDIMIHVSNHDFPFWGGITQSVKIGTPTAIHLELTGSKSLQIVVSIIYFLYALYTIYGYVIHKNKKERALLYYGTMLTIAGITVLIDDNVVWQLPISVDMYYKLLLFLFVSILFTTLKFINHLFHVQSKSFRVLTGMYILIVISEFIIPFRHLTYVVSVMTIFYILALTYLFFHTIKAIRQGYIDGIFILLFVTSYSSNVIWGAGINLGVDFPFYPFDFLISIIVISLFMFKSYARISNVNAEQLKQLQIADERKNRFLANTSHELRNPLHGMINIAQSMLDHQDHSITKNHKEDLKLLVRIGKQMTFTLNDILDMTRLSDQDIQLEVRNVNLHNVTTGVLDMIGFMTEGKDVILEQNIPPSFPEIRADENRLIQILFNLIHNAVKFTNEGSVIVEASYRKDVATVTITDTGIGMNEGFLETLFQPYSQEDVHIGAGRSGIGLGLHICKQLVKLHDGIIGVESTLGEGSVFSFTIPLADPSIDIHTHEQDSQMFTAKNRPPTSEVAATSVQESANDIKILLVDDDPVNLRILTNILSKDYHVLTATSGAMALKILESGQWDLIISDVMMPNMSGYELTERIREQFSISELPIILLTARNQAEDIYTGFVAGANDYVAKPMDQMELKARVKALTILKKSVNERLRMEAAWLQAQIQPHFLFNTLNTIASLSEIDTTRMVQLLNVFGEYLQRSFDIRNTQPLISLKNELELTRAYLYIEEERFGSRLRVEWKVDEGLNVRIPPLSIQPLVENAVRHGVLRRRDGGTITVEITDGKEHYIISIHDDGVGISTEKIEQILNDQPTEMTGVGVTNTNHRLKKLYGKGLMITSVVGQGTTVQFHIPK